MLGSTFRLSRFSVVFTWSFLVNTLKVLYYLILLIALVVLPFFSFLLLALFFIISRFIFSLWWLIRSTKDVGLDIADKTYDIGSEAIENLAEGAESAGNFIMETQEKITNKLKEEIGKERIRAKKIIKEGSELLDSKL